MLTQRDALKFCNVCGGELQQAESHVTCPDCGRNYYLNAKPCVAIVLTTSNNEILLTKRAVDPFKDWWDIPGGFVEENETLEAAIERELKEETGLVAESLQYIGSVFEEYEFRSELVPIVAAVFSGTVPEGSKVAVADDVSDYKFVRLEDVDTNLIAFENQRKFLRDYIEHLSA